MTTDELNKLFEYSGKSFRLLNPPTFKSVEDIIIYMATVPHTTVYDTDGGKHFIKFDDRSRNRSINDCFIITTQFFPEVTPQEFCQKVVDLCVARKINSLHCNGIQRQMLTIPKQSFFYLNQGVDKNGIAGTASITKYLRSLTPQEV